MDWTFKNTGIDLDELQPEVKEKALEIAEQLVHQENISEKEAINRGVKQAEEWFYNREG